MGTYVVLCYMLNTRNCESTLWLDVYTQLEGVSFNKYYIANFFSQRQPQSSGQKHWLCFLVTIICAKLSSLIQDEDRESRAWTTFVSSTMWSTQLYGGLWLHAGPLSSHVDHLCVIYDLNDAVIQWSLTVCSARKVLSISSLQDNLPSEQSSEQIHWLAFSWHHNRHKIYCSSFNTWAVRLRRGPPSYHLQCERRSYTVVFDCMLSS